MNARFASFSPTGPDTQSLLDALTSLDSISPYDNSTLDRFLTIAEILRCNISIDCVGFCY